MPPLGDEVGGEDERRGAKPQALLRLGTWVVSSYVVGGGVGIEGRKRRAALGTVVVGRVESARNQQ